MCICWMKIIYDKLMLNSFNNLVRTTVVKRRLSIHLCSSAIYIWWHGVALGLSCSCMECVGKDRIPPRPSMCTQCGTEQALTTTKKASSHIRMGCKVTWRCAAGVGTVVQDSLSSVVCMIYAKCERCVKRLTHQLMCASTGIRWSAGTAGELDFVPCLN